MPNFNSGSRRSHPTGERRRQARFGARPELAKSLTLISATDANSYYGGDLARTIASYASNLGAPLTADDLAQHTSTWVTPISTSYREHAIWEIPPYTQGLAALLGLNFVEGFDLRQLGRENVNSYHLQIEALKLAFTDTQRYVADMAQVRVPVAGLLAKDYAQTRRLAITDRAMEPTPGNSSHSDTAYLCTADENGMMVGFIQSTFSSFGLGIVVSGTGFALQNRSSGFSLDPSHPNVLAPGKRPFHMIIPGFLTKSDRAIGPFGVMGGPMQPQGHLQMIVNTIDYDLNPQAILNAPRWFWWHGRYIKIESTVEKSIVDGLRDRGHEVEVDLDFDVFGRGQIIWRLPSGVYVAGSDGCAIGF